MPQFKSSQHARLWVIEPQHQKTLPGQRRPSSAARARSGWCARRPAGGTPGPGRALGLRPRSLQGGAVGLPETKQALGDWSPPSTPAHPRSPRGPRGTLARPHAPGAPWLIPAHPGAPALTSAHPGSSWGTPPCSPPRTRGALAHPGAGLVARALRASVFPG